MAKSKTTKRSSQKLPKFLTPTILILVICLMGISIFNYFNKPQYLIEGFSDNNPTLVLFYADWCGHCKKMKSDWDKFEKKYSNNCKKIEEKNITQEHRTKYDVKGYPTILLIKDDEVIETYNGPRNYEGFESFIKKHI
tara:strand:+ start:582 stop:995 length:414 start_codon:yes stop_codon:yes gene_type:complete